VADIPVTAEAYDFQGEKVKIELVGLENARNNLEELASTCEWATPFHTYDWLLSLEKNLGTKCNVAVFDKGTAICPLFKKKTGPVEISFSPVFGTETAYMGILQGSGAPGRRSADIDEKLKQLKKEVGNFFMILPPGASTGFSSIEPAKTIITKLDKPNADEHFKTVKKGHRYCVKKAEKDGVTIEEDYSDSAIDSYYDLLVSTYDASEYTPLPKEFYKDIIQGLHKKNKIKVIFAKHNGKAIGCAAFPHIDKTIYYWTGASLKGEYAKLYPNNAIQWHLIKWAYEQGFKKYDMLGASIEGIRKFKLGWGGELVDYTRVYSSTGLKTAATAYSKLGTGLKKRIRSGVR